MTDDRAVRLALEAGRLRLERDALRATVARVEALADEAERECPDPKGWIWVGVPAIRAALDGAQ